MKTLVIGAGEVGTNIARTLIADGQEVTVIESDRQRADQARTELDALVVEGNGASPRLLKETGVRGFDLVAAVTTIDEVNVIAALSAKGQGVGAVVARVRDPDFFDQGQASQTGVMGIDFVIDPDRATADDIAETIALPGSVSVEYFSEGRLALVELIVGEDSPLVGRPLSERERPQPAYIVGGSRAGTPFLARPDTVPEVGDHLIVSTARENVREAVAHLVGHVEPIRNVVIFGGGRIGLPLARALEERNVAVTVLERDAERSTELATALGHALVINDEGISREAQEDANVGTAGAFVACAGDDRANLVAALNAKRVGAGLCFATISREEFAPLVDALGLDASFSPRLITAEAILRFVHTKSVKEIHLFRTGFEAMEMEVEPGAEIIGMAVGETHGILKHCRVGALLHDDTIEIPKRGTEIAEGDRLLVLGEQGTLRGIETSFGGGQ
ncbi:MAG: Trk system potassium transporter TrkA [Solirubrobacterales bacterium]